MEILLEIIFDLLFEGSIEIVKCKKVSKWIRYPLIAIFAALYIFLIGVIGFLGIALIASEQPYTTFFGIFFLIIEIILIISGVKKIKDEIKIRKTEK